VAENATAANSLAVHRDRCERLGGGGERIPARCELSRWPLVDTAFGQQETAVTNADRTAWRLRKRHRLASLRPGRAGLRRSLVGDERGSTIDYTAGTTEGRFPDVAGRRVPEPPRRTGLQAIRRPQPIKTHGMDGSRLQRCFLRRDRTGAGMHRPAFQA